ncbi:hypothetical protein FHU28_005136 [Micromonospora echinospora]|uniref:Acetyltransferase (GNAT) family protein n=1 Tax=Micromonospora echinospora TaxID=1877 RepID=A0ABR6MLT5_MICEC|nr:GNAT family N-acetyltransferase [Micromonospora echinospora]MBB5115297.1 hypothetical protein [Micromonospora echinospora]
MGDARPATPSDAEELVRLRGLMLAGMSGAPTPPGRWQDIARDNLRTWLAEPDPWLAAFVVDAPDGASLAACAVGTVERRLGGPDDPSAAGRPLYRALGFRETADPAMRLTLPAESFIPPRETGSDL